MKHRGFTLFEVSVAIILLGVLTALCLQFFSGVTGQQKDQNAELTATEEAANLMERLAAVAWDDLSKQTGEKFQLSPQALKMLPEPRVEVKVDEATGTPPARRIAVAVAWRPLPGGPERKARVVAWRYKYEAR
jgi:prepilin-type N-terminal cleavage/methylation domain-containing protein